jgi:hypothetical protein
MVIAVDTHTRGYQCVTVVVLIVEIKKVRSEVFTAVVRKNSVIWNKELCSPSKINRYSEDHVTSIFKVE